MTYHKSKIANIQFVDTRIITVWHFHQSRVVERVLSSVHVDIPPQHPCCMCNDDAMPSLKLDVCAHYMRFHFGRGIAERELHAVGDNDTAPIKETQRAETSVFIREKRGGERSGKMHRYERRSSRMCINMRP